MPSTTSPTEAPRSPVSEAGFALPWLGSVLEAPWGVRLGPGDDLAERMLAAWDDGARVFEVATGAEPVAAEEMGELLSAAQALRAARRGPSDPSRRPADRVLAVRPTRFEVDGAGAIARWHAELRQSSAATA
ncbi:MAG: hypothetical protein JRI23_14260, partial [Deltaproteobacteria bacterium]|nr:hypothetical protein [Deltaproteobacteria bacterium]MBW2532908.1 hypothetical protein [Deltaproteobacteria bacterium]